MDPVYVSQCEEYALELCMHDAHSPCNADSVSAPLVCTNTLPQPKQRETSGVDQVPKIR